MDSFYQITIVFGLVALGSFVMMLLKQPLVIGQIIIGAIAGPFALGILDSSELLLTFSKLGIIALLFTVGIHFSPRIIREVGKSGLLAGIAQVLLTAFLGMLFGTVIGFEIRTAAFVGLAFAFSSTIVVSKLLSDKHELTKLHGKIAIGILCVQDIIATVLLLMIIARPDGLSPGAGLAILLARFVVCVLVTVFLARLGLRLMGRNLARSQEFLFLAALGWAFGVAALFAKLGLSPEIGALVSGVALANSPYAEEMSAKMRLLRDFFLVPFFVLLGATISFSTLSDIISPAVAFSLFVLIGNPIIILTIMGLLGYHRRTSFMTAVALAQISEFSLVFLVLASNAGYVSNETLQIAALVGVITIAVSSQMILNTERLYSMLAVGLRLFEREGVVNKNDHKEVFDIILFGCRRTGNDFIRLARRHGQRLLAVDFNPEVVAALTALNVPCRYGDASDQAFLEELPLERAKLIVSTIPEEETNSLILSTARAVNKAITVVVSAENISEANKLYDRGAAYVIMPHYLGGNYAALFMDEFGPHNKIIEKEKLRHLRYLSEAE